MLLNIKYNKQNNWNQKQNYLSYLLKSIESKLWALEFKVIN